MSQMAGTSSSVASRIFMASSGAERAPRSHHGMAPPRIQLAGAAPRPIFSHEILRRALMAAGRCEVCGNDYDKTFQVTVDGEIHTFDAFECAIESLAPRCAHC